MTFSMNGYEEWKEKNRNEKAEISKMDLIASFGIAAAAAMPKDAGVGVVAASREIAKIIREFFPEKKEEEPDAEKTAPSALEKLLFEQAYLAAAQCAAESSVVHHAAGSSGAYSSFKALYGLVMDAGLEEKYNFWKTANGYE